MAYDKTWETFRNEYVSEYGSWAADALPVNIKAPNAARIANGWTIEQPPHNFFNWHMNRTDNRLIDAEARLAWMALHYQDVPLSLTSLLTLDDEDVALSAAGGKALNDRIDVLKEVTDRVSESAGTGKIPAAGDDGKIDKEWLPSTFIAGGIVMFSGTFGGSDGKRPIPKGATAADEGWVICDGTNGTPNLAGRFIVASGGGYAVGNTGGVVTTPAATASGKVTVSGTTGATTLAAASMPRHRHTIPAANNTTGGGDWANRVIRHPDSGEGTRTTGYAGGDANGKTTSHSHSFAQKDISISTAVPAHDNRPPYYVLAFIMKLPG